MVVESGLSRKERRRPEEREKMGDPGTEVFPLEGQK